MGEWRAKDEVTRGKDMIIPKGLLRESNPGPLAPKARIIPLDQAAAHVMATFTLISHSTECNKVS